MDKILFSERLSALRQERGYKSQLALAKAYNEKFPPKRRDEAGGNETNASGILGTIKNYENPAHTGSPKLEIVLNLCTLLDCDIGYLVGDYNQKTIDTNRIQQVTGLLEPSIERLKKANRDISQGFTQLPELNNLLLSDDFWAMLSDLWFFRYQCNAAETRPLMIEGAKEKGDIEAITRFAKDYDFAIKDKDILLLHLQRHLFRIADEIEKGAKPNGIHNKTRR